MKCQRGQIQCLLQNIHSSEEDRGTARKLTKMSVNYDKCLERNQQDDEIQCNQRSGERHIWITMKMPQGGIFKWMPKGRTEARSLGQCLFEGTELLEPTREFFLQRFGRAQCKAPIFTAGAGGRSQQRRKLRREAGRAVETVRTQQNRSGWTDTRIVFSLPQAANFNDSSYFQEKLVPLSWSYTRTQHRH